MRVRFQCLENTIQLKATSPYLYSEVLYKSGCFNGNMHEAHRLMISPASCFRTVLLGGYSHDFTQDGNIFLAVIPYDS